jgi:hypothetical protein
MSKELVEIRKQAEAAVHDMQEGELKIKAFETILSHLLTSGGGGNSKGERAAPAKPAAPKRENEASATVPTTREERILFIKGENFFASQKSINEIRLELKKSGWHYATTALSGPLQTLVQKRLLRREKLSSDGKKRGGWMYSNP